MLPRVAAVYGGAGHGRFHGCFAGAGEEIDSRAAGGDAVDGRVSAGGSQGEAAAEAVMFQGPHRDSSQVYVKVQKEQARCSREGKAGRRRRDCASVCVSSELARWDNKTPSRATNIE